MAGDPSRFAEGDLATETLQPLGESEQDRALCLHTIIEGWASRTPDAIAVAIGGQTLSYGELNKRANQLARWLCGHKIGVGSLVGVSMKRSLDLIIGVLAILKSGAAYVPLDPRLPEERLRFLVADAVLGVILTRASGLQLDGTLVIDVAAEPFADANPENLPSDVEIGDLVYVIYTSGSTGQPKGVMVPHRGVVNWLVWMRNTFQVTPDDVVLKKAPLTFDVSAWELFLPLISGARLVLADSDRQYDPAYLASLMDSQAVTIAQFVPSLLRSFLDLENLPDLSALRHVMCGGEIMTSQLQARFFERLTSEVCNSYGPTEASIGVTRWPCRRDDRRPTVPIGGPIDNTELYILDTALEPVPPGIAGELYIGGRCLGRGYLNRPDLTAERFLPNPFNPEGEARMYRTGDLCRFLPDGSIDFLGRIDDQVKVRGVRIELAEVEQAIAQHVGVKAVAATTEQQDGETTLLAYVVAAGDQALTDRELRRFLRKKLPLAMIPSEFLFVDTLPLSANGKIDRKRLQMLRPAPEPCLPPRDGVERDIAAIWAQLLGTESFGVQDDFFDSGGDSLLVTQLLIRLERRFGVRVTLDRVLGALTIEVLADILRDAKTAVDQQPMAAPSAVRRTVRQTRNEISCRIADPDDIAGIWRVCKKAFDPYAVASLDQFRELCLHRWLNNPARTDDDPFGWVLESDPGHIIGFHGLVPTRIWAGSRSYSGIAPTTWAVEPGHGRAGLELLTTYLNWGVDRFLLNTTANAITSAMHESSGFGMKRIPLDGFDERLLWILDYRTLLRWKVAQSHAPRVLQRIAALPVVEAAIGAAAPFVFGIAGGGRAALHAGFGSMRIRFSCRPLDIAPISHFGPEFDDLWDRLKHHHDVTTERSAMVLNWRHINPPALLGRSRALSCRENGTLVGYVAVREPATTASGHLIVTDLFYDPDRTDVLHNLMNAVFDLAVSGSLSVIEMFGFHPSVHRELQTQHPFVLRRSQLERLGRGVSFASMMAALNPMGRTARSSTYWYRAPNSDLDKLCDEGRWWPSGIDGDLNL